MISSKDVFIIEKKNMENNRKIAGHDNRVNRYQRRRRNQENNIDWPGMNLNFLLNIYFYISEYSSKFY